jgi:hypothetical protein
MKEDMKGEYMYHGMKGGWMHRGMKMSWMKKFLSEDDMKKLALKKLDMKVARTEQKLEFLLLMREMLKEKM